MKIKISDLLNLSTVVEVSPGKPGLPVRALSLNEMMKLFMDSQDIFLKLYSMGFTMNRSQDLAGFLLAAPEVVVRIIAVASDCEGQEEDIAKIPATVQLIALFEIWKLSVPDPKKAKELLSEVTAQLRRLSPKAVQKAEEELQRTSQLNSSTTSLPESNSSSPVDIPFETS
jgi:hypothetical protein